jgi:hypothetical protein
MYAHNSCVTLYCTRDSYRLQYVPIPKKRVVPIGPDRQQAHTEEREREMRPIKDQPTICKFKRISRSIGIQFMAATRFIKISWDRRAAQSPIPFTWKLLHARGTGTVRTEEK